MKKTSINLIPDRTNPSPDYYCTWQTQLYATCDGKPPAQRANIGEKMLFDTEKPFGWAYFYENARRDLLLVMDDSWDVPLDGDTTYYGSLLLSKEKFPAATQGNVENREALKRLSDRIKSLGWKGLGGWVCAQESERFFSGETQEDYWSARLADADYAGFSYWKVDWGKHGNNADFRKMLTRLGKKLAPGLTIEQAMIPDILPDSATYRTYDVPAIMSIPMTMRKLQELYHAVKPEKGCSALINCEDEAYIAAAGGFAMGIMRHPYRGEFIDGRADMSFPAVHRNLKTKMCEVARATRWHRISPAFGIGEGETLISQEMLCDSWQFVNKEEEIEAWWFNHPFFKNLENDTISISAPARIARGCALPQATPEKNGLVPYMVASKSPDGHYAIATLGRTMGRTYEIPRCDVTAEIATAGTVAAFGDYASLTLTGVMTGAKTIYMQDLASDFAYDVTEEVRFERDTIIIPGELIRKIGTAAQPAGDTSEPGVIMQIR